MMRRSASSFSDLASRLFLASKPGGPFAARAFGSLLLFAGVVLWAGCGASRPTPAGYAGDDARAFVVKHRAELQEEIAAGSGPRLYDLAIIANCQDVPQLGRRLHRRRDDIFAPAGTAESATPNAATAGPDTPDAEVAARLVRFMADNRELRCLGLDASRTGALAGGRRQIGPSRSQVTRRGGSW